MEKFKKVRTIADIQNDPRVESFESEGHRDYWVYLKQGYVCTMMGCGTIHEPTISMIADLLNNDVERVCDALPIGTRVVCVDYGKGTVIGSSENGYHIRFDEWFIPDFIMEYDQLQKIQG